MEYYLFKGNKEDPAICYNMDGPQNIILNDLSWGEKDKYKRQILYDTIHIWNFKKSNL